jgi:hypothetical protein
MSEAAEKIFTASAPERVPAEPAKPAACPPQSKRTQPAKWTHRQLLALAAVGSTFGFLTGWGLWNEIYFHSVEFILAAIPAALATYVLFDPAQEWLVGKHESNEGASERRGIAAFTTAAVAVLLVSLFHRSLDVGLNLKELGDHLGEEAKVAVHLQELANSLSGTGVALEKAGDLSVVLVALSAFLSVGLAAILVTHFWAHGVRRHPPRALHWSTPIGLIFGLAAAAALIHYLASVHLLYYWPSWVLVALGVFWFLVPACAGGIALQQLEANSSPTRAIRTYVLLSSAFYLVAFAIFAAVAGYVFSPFKEKIYGWIWLPIAALAGQNLGWAFGPYFRRELYDDYLRCPEGESVPESVPEAAAQKASNVVPMPVPEGSSVLAKSADVAGTPAARAKDLIFKPKGDRLLATAALVLTLITSAFAYHLGTLRGDPDIHSNIDERIKQDSGLETKDLKVVSSGQVVTISGTVDDEAEHAKAIREISSVRGVKQIIDQIQIAAAVPAPAPTPAPAQPVPAAASPAAPSVPAINAAVSIGISHGSSNASAAAPKHPTAASAPKHHGVFDVFKKNQAKAATAQKQGSQATAQNAKQTASTKPADDNQKKGFFHFLKKDKKNKSDKPQK